MTPLEPWKPVLPDYLQDLTQTAVTPNCSCSTVLGKKKSVNGVLYESGAVLHESYVGAVVERRLQTNSHPYHQHVEPFQIVQGFGAAAPPQDSKNDFYRVGDWHDVIQGSGVVRYRPLQFTGKLMVHCHRLQHEDEGMMATEYVHAANSGLGCTCWSSGAVSLPWGHVCSVFGLLTGLLLLCIEIVPF